MAHNDIWTLRANITTGNGITLLQMKANANAGFEVLSASLTQRGNTTSEEDEICLVRKTAAATVSVAVTGGVSGNLFAHDPNQPWPPSAASGPQLGTNATGVNATAEGTDGDMVVKQGFNILNGWLYLPTPEERIWVPPAGIIALKFMAPPGSSNSWDAEMRVREL